MSTSPKLSVVFSFRNEAEVLAELVRRMQTVLRQEIGKGGLASYELIFVNDASSDQSLSVLLEHKKADNAIRILNMSRPFGVSPCVMAGLEHSTGDVVAYMDADLQDPPEVIPDLLDAWRKQGVDVVHTVRRRRKGESSFKLWLTRLGYAILHRTASIRLPVEAGDFKLLSRRAVNHLVRLREHQPFTRGLVCWIGFPSAIVYYDREPRFAGTTKFAIFSPSVINNFLESALISFSAAPLKIAVLMGFLSIFVDLALLAHVLSEKFQGKAIPGWTAIMLAIIFIGSMQFFCIGIIGLYVNSIFLESKARPNYIIESSHGFVTQQEQGV